MQLRKNTGYGRITRRQWIEGRSRIQRQVGGLIGGLKRGRQSSVRPRGGMSLVWIVRHCDFTLLCGYLSSKHFWLAGKTIRFEIFRRPVDRFRAGSALGIVGAPPGSIRTNSEILAHPCYRGMRLLRQRRQLRQIVTSYSSGCASHLIVGADADLGGLRAVEPLSQFTFTKSPLPAAFDGRNFFTLGPQAKSTRCNPQ